MINRMKQDFDPQEFFTVVSSITRSFKFRIQKCWIFCNVKIVRYVIRNKFATIHWDGRTYRVCTILFTKSIICLCDDDEPFYFGWCEQQEY